MLGCVAAVMEMVSPSQLRPAVIQITSIWDSGAGLASFGVSVMGGGPWFFI